MSVWKCRYCGILSFTDLISEEDGVCRVHPSGAGNHHFAQDDSMVNAAKAFVERENNKIEPAMARIRCEESHYQLMAEFAILMRDIE